jgi:ABC-2 type transport system ATP-binding protein
MFMGQSAAIFTEAIGRVYKIREAKKNEPKELIALTDVNLQVQPGELFGLLGPNGAGKTTLIKILTTLLSPTTGRAEVAGFDVDRSPFEIRRRINMVSGGESSGYGLLTVRENLWMFSQFYGIPSKQANLRIKEMLEVVGLSDRINAKSSDLSTGLRQKMNIVRGFMTDPQVIFLDEPTSGLDVGAARDVRHFIRGWIDKHTDRSVMLTTHYMVEADELCDRVAIINQGKVLACDTPAALKRALRQESIFQLEVTPLNGTGGKHLEGIPGVRHYVEQEVEGGAELTFILEDESILASVINQLSEGDVHLKNLEKREPTLEDVFVDLVGKSMEEVEDAGSK